MTPQLEHVRKRLADADKKLVRTSEVHDWLAEAERLPAVGVTKEQVLAVANEWIERQVRNGVIRELSFANTDLLTRLESLFPLPHLTRLAGKIENVQTFDRDLTQAEVAELAAAPPASAQRGGSEGAEPAESGLEVVPQDPHIQAKVREVLKRRGFPQYQEPAPQPPAPPEQAADVWRDNYGKQLDYANAYIDKLTAENAKLRNQFANLAEIRNTLDAHVAEACEMLGATKSETPCDSWTLRELCSKAAAENEKLRAEVERLTKELHAAGEGGGRWLKEG
jgi:hypothetical protein